MLLKRIITASVLASLIALAVFKLPMEYFSLVIGLVTLLAAWEWSNLAGVTSLVKRVLFLLVLILPMLGIHFWTQILELIAQALDWPDVRDYSGILEWLVIPPVLFWILVMILIRNTPTGVLNLTLKTRYKVLIGWFVLLSAWMFLSRLRAFYGTEMTMYFLILIWVADISAYFAGKKWGVTKLAPEISPGKTVAGMYGALIAGLVCAVALSLIYGFNLMIASDFMLLSVLTVLISIYGDLFVSVVKRQRGVKDSGSLLPGHGGVLDRIDSMIAAIPFFYGCIYFIYRLVS
ncbi:MAG: phosphatidate cytidylyltransferase [Methylococcaceae bacterium]|jgi:phosphatidate cytidylyltransferase|nr:phosphatidate cytidylyltransferase [Methylococcaceae bacterium]MDD1629348.1 phosphatidate cytidylyltransferase [Methylococcaceae bacterium]MDD1634716.1 phosphatidate cytidylyltransferase [Methylococcaceae bacterium]MDD1640014.1 phosphatidate cytidylyltransferase [Methylococcaceae bacterium]OYV23570.1 MAG: phosphatidate cytidylyltransferase [Methylococcaceae bacterium NSO1]